MKPQEYLEIAVNITVLITAVFAVIKFKLYEVLNPRYDTDMKVEQQCIGDKIYLICTYVIKNTGELPISLLSVSLNFYEAKEDDGQIKCLEEGNSLPQRVFKASNRRYRDLMKISAGERSEFPIRGIFKFKKKEEVQALFIYGSFKWKHKKKTFPYHKIVLISTKESS